MSKKKMTLYIHDNSKWNYNYTNNLNKVIK